MAEGGVKRERKEEEEEEESSDEVYEPSLAGMAELLEDMDRCVKRAKRHYNRLCEYEDKDDPDGQSHMAGLHFHNALDDLSKHLKQYEKDTGDC